MGLLRERLHAQNGSAEIRKKLAALGAWISLDNVENRKSRVEKVYAAIMNLKKAGLLNRVLISHDAGWYRVDEVSGGKFTDFTDIFTHLIPKLKESGITEEEMNLLLRENPIEAYSVHLRLN